MVLLRRGEMTVDELAAELGVTANAIRVHVASLERDGMITRTGRRPSASKPAFTYGLTPDAELLFSRIYAPMLTELLHVLSRRLKPAAFRSLMRQVGAALMGDRPRPRGSPQDRANAACELLNDLGGHTTVQRHDGTYVIRSYGCPLAAATLEHPEACLAMEALLREFTALPVKSCCAVEERLRCCFAMPPERGRSARAPARRHA